MLNKKINFLFSAIGCTNTDIAKYAGCDASHISRMRTGTRKPLQNNRSSIRLVDGIYGYCDNYNLLDALCKVCNCKPDLDAQAIKKALLSWLFSDSVDYENIKDIISPVNRNKSFRFFGDKLDAVMNMLELSNVRLSKALNIDASYISRFRNGVRTPRSENGMVNVMCTYLTERIIQQNKTEELARIMRVSAETLNDTDYLYEAFFNWMCDKPDEVNEHTAQLLLDSIDRFSLKGKTTLPDFNSVVNDAVLNSNAQHYVGNGGLREAVLRFLGNAIKHNVKELWLYSDRNTDWMTQDTAYKMQWLTLMVACVRSGMKIKIIHTINRNISEMISAVENWVPLYMSAKIEPYYYKRKTDGVFSRTIFLCPGYACVESCHMVGFEDESIINYYTDSLHLDSLKAEYSSLLKLCEPLVRVIDGKNISEYMMLSGRFSETNGINALLSSPSICSMPEELLISMLERNEISKSDCKSIMDFYYERKRIYNMAMQKSFFYEMVSMPSDEELFSGKVYVNLGVALNDIKIAYTPEDFAKHIKAVIQQLSETPNYRFYSLSDSPFENVQFISDDTNTVVIKENEPHIAFVFSNPMLCKTFTEYAEMIQSRYEMDRNTLKRELKKYI